MVQALLRTTATRAALRASALTAPKAGLAGVAATRGKATLPDLKCKSFEKNQVPFFGGIVGAMG
jgi:hypothetical protein